MNNVTNKVTVSVIEWNSAAYLRCLDLRNEQLRRDEGLEDLLIAPLDEASCIHIAASDGADIVGAMHLLRVDDSEVRIKQVVVARSHRGRGIGGDMIAFAERISRELGYSVLTLSGTLHAWGFYDRLGFEACGPAYDWLETTCKPYRKLLRPPTATEPECPRREVVRIGGGTREPASRSQIDDLRRHRPAVVRKQANHRRAARAARV